MAIFPGSAIPSAAADYDIDNSCRFNDGDGYLRRTFPSAGNQKSWTWSGWVKKSLIDETFYMLATDYADTSNFMYFQLRKSHGTEAKNYTSQISWTVSGTARALLSTQKFRDCGAWMHIVVVCDTPNVTDTNKLRFYVNGDEITAWDTDDRSGISEDDDLPINRAGVHDICGWNGSGNTSGYLAEVYFIDGTALTPSSFAETNSTTNQWIPKDASNLTFGTNGFYQKYSSDVLANSFADSALHKIHTVTAYGDAHTDTSVKKFGTASLQLDGTGDYLSIPDSVDWDLGTGDFTIEFWAYGSANDNSTVIQLGAGPYMGLV